MRVSTPTLILGSVVESYVVKENAVAFGLSSDIVETSTEAVLLFFSKRLNFLNGNQTLAQVNSMLNPEQV